MTKSPFVALKNNNIPQLVKLLKPDPKLLEKTVSDRTILSMALIRGNTQAVQEILRMNPSKKALQVEAIYSAYKKKNIDLIRTVAPFIEKHEDNEMLGAIVAIAMSDPKNSDLLDFVPYQNPEIAFYAMEFACKMPLPIKAYKNFKTKFNDDERFFDPNKITYSPTVPTTIKTHRDYLLELGNSVFFSTVASKDPDLLIKIMDAFGEEGFYNLLEGRTLYMIRHLLSAATKDEEALKKLTEWIIDTGSPLITDPDTVYIGARNSSVTLLEKYFDRAKKDIEPNALLPALGRASTKLIKNHPELIEYIIEETKKHHEIDDRVVHNLIFTGCDFITSRVIDQNKKPIVGHADQSNIRKEFSLYKNLVFQAIRMPDTITKMNELWPDDFIEGVAQAESISPGSLISKLTMKPNTETLKLLQKIGISSANPDLYGNPITEALRNGADREFIDSIISLCPQGLQTKNRHGQCALMETIESSYLSENKKIKIAEKLITLGVNIEGEFCSNGEKLSDNEFVKAAIKKVNSGNILPFDQKKLIDGLTSGKINPLKAAKTYVANRESKLAATAVGFCNTEEIRNTKGLSAIVISNWQTVQKSIFIKKEIEESAKQNKTKGI